MEIPLDLGMDGSVYACLPKDSSISESSETAENSDPMVTREIIKDDHRLILEEFEFAENPSPTAFVPRSPSSSSSDCSSTNNNNNILWESQDQKMTFSRFEENFEAFNESFLFDAIEEVVEEVETSVEDDLSNPDVEPPKQETRNPKTRLFHCHSCDKSFRYSSRLQRHLTTHQRKQFHCTICDKYFSRMDVLSTHMERVHSVVTAGNSVHKKSDNGTDNYRCEECNVSLKSLHHYERHIRAHQSRRGPFTCETCGKTFQLKHQYQRHCRLHWNDDKKKYKCHVCDRAFLQQEFLRRHLLTHSGESPFKCEWCDKRFNQAVNLRLHTERVHTRVLKNECHECGKLFFTASELRNHSLYHLQKRSFQCSACGQSFYEKRHLNRHIRRVHAKIKNFYCKSCGKMFHEKYELNYHLKKKNKRCCQVEK